MCVSHTTKCFIRNLSVQQKQLTLGHVEPFFSCNCCVFRRDENTSTQQPPSPPLSQTSLSNRITGAFRLAATLLMQAILTKPWHCRGRCFKCTAPPSPPLNARSDISVSLVECCQALMSKNTSLDTFTEEVGHF